jgi:serine/threonine protein kinase
LRSPAGIPPQRAEKKNGRFGSSRKGLMLKRETTFLEPAAAFANVLQGSFEVKPEEIRIHEKIGEGAMAVIYRANMRNFTCVAKKLKNSTQTNSQVLRRDGDRTTRTHIPSVFTVPLQQLNNHGIEQAYKDLIMELEVLTSVGKHQNIVEFYGACVQDSANPVILEEFVEGPNLEQFLAVIFVQRDDMENIQDFVLPILVCVMYSFL